MPVLTARGAGVRRRRQRRHRDRDPWLFRALDVSVEPGDLVAIVGPPGSGRTTVLLALVRRFRLGAGRVELGGRASLGYVPDVSTPESVFTVTEHVRERLMLLGRSRSEAAGVELHGLDPQKQGHDLSPYEKQVLGLLLAELAAPAVIALDGYDDGLDSRERDALWQLITDLTTRGIAVLVTAREIDPSRVTTVIRLGDDPAPTIEWDQASTPGTRPPGATEPTTVPEEAAEPEPTAVSEPTVEPEPDEPDAVDGTSSEEAKR